MATKTNQHKVKLIGPGLSFERPVTGEVANRIISLVMGEASATGEFTPRQFLAQKRPSSNYERVACLAYYLTHNRNLRQFRTADITELGREAAVHLSNPSLFVQHATSTYHYLVPAGGGKKQITTLGGEVVEAMPDRERVNAAIAKRRPQRRRRGRVKGDSL
jgi:hypothetical protein